MLRGYASHQRNRCLDDFLSTLREMLHACRRSTNSSSQPSLTSVMILMGSQSSTVCFTCIARCLCWLFEKYRGSQCPGLVKVNFYSDGKPTGAVVLISGENPKRKAELALYRHWLAMVTAGFTCNECQAVCYNEDQCVLQNSAGRTV